MCSQKKRVSAVRDRTFCLIQPSKPGKGSRQQTVISIGSSSFVFCNSYFLSMAVLRPGGAVILSEPQLSVCKLLSLCSVFASTSCHAEKVYPGLWSKGEFGPCALLFPLGSDTDLGLHAQITGRERKTLMSPCQV